MTEKKWVEVVVVFALGRGETSAKNIFVNCTGWPAGSLRPGLRREHPGDPVPAGSRPKGPRPWDPAITSLARMQHYGLLFFYNKIHDFWDGSVYNPDGEPLPEANAIIRDILKRQVESDDGELVRHTAKERKQMAKAKPYRVQKQTTERNLRRRKPPADAQRASHASPALTQITVAGSDQYLGIGPEDDGVDEEIAPTGLAVSAADHDQDAFRRQQEPRTSPPAAIKHNAKVSPMRRQTAAQLSCMMEQATNPLRRAPGAVRALRIHRDDGRRRRLDEHGHVHGRLSGHGGLWRGRPQRSDLDIDMAMDMLSNAGELQEPPGSHSPKAPTASLSATSAVASAASPHEAAGGNRQTSSATTTDESAPQPAPNRTGRYGQSQHETARASQPAPIASAQSPNPPVTATQTPYRCTPEEVLVPCNKL
ncbi:hypothetical protein B0J15DRAFT_539656 [Fusarium solani]|uniref:Uncharacterized protein n=1 Tax=Fusarium solani TaxID=169388 RepID=A0A9P9G0H0_FUSSL|nr:uncharacterized protein B0J15DRAFT_539656 [Fusarium solani]KAH7229958.1 hypothetical protein B0J15DRAFT_539656 [Fusarium solani]